MVTINQNFEGIDLKTQKVWIVVGNEFKEKGITDGSSIFVPSALGENHADEFEEICNYFDVPTMRSERDFADYFSKLGVLIFSNGMKLDGKYIGNIYLPEQLTNKQIEFLEKIKPIFDTYFYKKPNFFGVSVSQGNGKSRDLYNEVYIEMLMRGEDPSKIDGQQLLYDEVEKQKNILKSGRVL